MVGTIPWVCSASWTHGAHHLVFDPLVIAWRGWFRWSAHKLRETKCIRPLTTYPTVRSVSTYIRTPPYLLKVSVQDQRFQIPRPNLAISPSIHLISLLIPMSKRYTRLIQTPSRYLFWNQSCGAVRYITYHHISHFFHIDSTLFTCEENTTNGIRLPMAPWHKNHSGQQKSARRSFVSPP